MFRFLRKLPGKSPIKPLDHWFDRVSDGWNPITVRDLRRMKRSMFFTIATIAHLGLLIFVHVADLKDPHAPEFLEIVQRMFPTYAALLIVVLLAIGSDVRARLADELFDTVPLTPKEKVHGILGTSCLLSAFFVVQALPFLLFPPIEPYSAMMRLGILLGMFIVTQVITLYFLSFFIRTKTVAEVVITFFIVIYLGGLVLQFPQFPLLMFLSGLLTRSNDALMSWPFIAVASLGGVLMLSSFAYLNYRLSLYHLGYQVSQYHFDNRSENCWMATGINLVCHAVWSSSWAVIAFVVVSSFV